MIVVADASVLVAELLRRRGRALLAHPALRVVVAQEQWSETDHGLQRRLDAMVEQAKLTAEQAGILHDAIRALIEDRVIDVVPREILHTTRPSLADVCRVIPTTGRQSLSPLRCRPESSPVTRTFSAVVVPLGPSRLSPKNSRHCDCAAHACPIADPY